VVVSGAGAGDGASVVMFGAGAGAAVVVSGAGAGGEVVVLFCSGSGHHTPAQSPMHWYSEAPQYASTWQPVAVAHDEPPQQQLPLSSDNALAVCTASAVANAEARAKRNMIPGRKVMI
jgi:hypothetical protein